MTYRMDEDSMIERIDQSRFVEGDESADEALKSVFKRAMQELCGYTRRILNDIEQTLLFPEDPCSIGEIVVALAQNANCAPGKNEYPAMTKMAASTDPGVYFIDADHGSFKKIVGDVDSEKTYEGVYRLGQDLVKYRYRLKFDDRFLQQQDLLSRMASLYKVDNAIIHSPYIRRAVNVCVLDEIPSKACEQDHQFAQNGIPAIEDAALLWNLQACSTELLKAEERVPYGQEIKYKFHFKRSKEGRWRYAVPQNNQTIVYQICFSEDGIDLLLDHELETFFVIEYRAVDWDELEIKKLIRQHRIHSNYVKRSAISNPRIISEGDIAFAIHPFRNTGSVKCEIATDLKKVCTRYSAKYRAQLHGRLTYTKLKQVKLKFSVDDPPAFYDDEINFVLQYLEYYYPEIEWIGGW